MMRPSTSELDELKGRKSTMAAGCDRRVSGSSSSYFCALNRDFSPLRESAGDFVITLLEEP
jgi:hypothetical protein